MQYITLDTNAWIYLANGTEPANGLEFIKNEVDQKTITLLIPSIVIDEWHTNKNNAVKGGVTKKFEEIDGGMQTILKLFGSRRTDNTQSSLSFYEGLKANKLIKADFQSIAHQFKKGRAAIERAVTANVNLVEALFSHPTSVIIQVTNDVMLKAGRFAIEKKGAFSEKKIASLML